MMVWGMNENGIDMTGVLYNGTAANYTKMPEGPTDPSGAAATYVNYGFSSFGVAAVWAPNSTLGI